MKKRILITLVSLVCLIVPSVLVIAKDTTSDKPDTIIIDFKLEVFREGQLSEKKLLVNLQIWKFNDTLDTLFVSWSHVHIEPLHNQKKVYLTSRHYTTAEGSIKNVRIGRDSFSLRLDPVEGLGLTADV